MSLKSSVASSSVGTIAYVGKEACHICTRTSMSGTTIHACKFCGRIVCADHSKHRKDLSSQLLSARICDKCHRDIICEGYLQDQKLQLQTLRRSVEDLSSTIQRRDAELTAKQDLVDSAAGKLKEIQGNAYKRRKELDGKLENARNQAIVCISAVRKVKSAVEVSGVCILKLKEAVCEKKAQQDAINREITLLLTDFPQFEEALRRSQDKLTHHWNKSVVFREFCRNCQKSVRLKLTSTTLSTAPVSRRSLDTKSCAQCVIS